MRYTCKDCGIFVYAKDFDEVMKNQKLCPKCLSTWKHQKVMEQLRREPFMAKPVKTKDSFRCTNCGTVGHSSGKCQECGCKALIKRKG